MFSCCTVLSCFASDHGPLQMLLVPDIITFGVYSMELYVAFVQATLIGFN
jgi:hypothetical protein